MLRFISLAALTLAAFVGTAYADPGTHSVLATPDGTVKGLVEVSPTAHDVLAPDTFDVQGTVNVRDLAPNTTTRCCAGSTSPRMEAAPARSGSFRATRR